MLKIKVHCLLIVVIITLFILLSFTASPTAKATEKPIPLRLATYLPPTHFADKIIREFCADLEKESGGRVKVQYFGAGSLGKTQELYEVVKTSVAEMSLVTPVYFQENFPLSLMMQLPFCTVSGAVGSEVLHQLYKKGFLGNEFTEVKLVFGFCTSPVQIFSNRKLLAVKDFKGLKLRTHGGPADTDTMKVMGAVPVSMGAPDTYPSLQRGIIDAATGNWAAAPGWKWQEVVKYGVDISLFGGSVNSICMNIKKWNELPKETQEAFMRVSERYRQKFAKLYDDDDAKSREIMRQAKVEVYAFPKEELAKLATLVIPVWEKWVKRNEEKGIPAIKTYKAYCEIMKSLGQEVTVRLPGI